MKVSKLQLNPTIPVVGISTSLVSFIKEKPTEITWKRKGETVGCGRFVHRQFSKFTISSYVPTKEDVGLKLEVVVTFNFENSGMNTSVETAEVLAGS